MGLQADDQKRKFNRTPEPRGRIIKSTQQRFVVQEHHASHLHFDFRLEIDSVLKSWSVPKGPSMNPADKRLAVETEDHPIAYLDFEGRIVPGNYGAGEVRVWDLGDYELVNQNDDPGAEHRDGKIKFILHGKKLRGEFHLIRLKRERQWLLMKADDQDAQTNWELETILPVEKKMVAARKKSSPKPVKKIKASVTSEAPGISPEDFTGRKNLNERQKLSRE